MKTIIIFHAFRDGCDHFCDTKQEALNVVKLWTDEGYQNIRIYKEIYEDIYEDCIYSIGDFPY